VAALALAAALPAAAAGGTGRIELRIAYRADGSAAAKVLSLRCDPARGTVARPASACRRLRDLRGTAFAPTPRGRACAQLFGGPMTALVTGVYEGRRVWARLSRVDGCAIARWDLVAFLFPPRPQRAASGATPAPRPE
jgi:hypothetical protein